MPCSLPSAQPAGAPVTAVVRSRLVPPGPCTKIRNVLPAFADPKLKNASIKFGLMITNGATVGTPLTGTTCVKVKHAPVINRSCCTAQLPFDGVTEMTIGALTPKSMAHVVVRVNGPKMLLSPAVNVVVAVTTAGPPQHADGNPEVDVAPKLAVVGIVARNRLQLTG